ncbi:hypothetical protein M514_09760 [Trichuris suis]|uniref:Uncharacterized protein n=1 Tax=Trichuris suis TaxID=68888 RepID=A0A085N4Z0_9BILA|nr:hypothetical protein M513_09760 [Trichuris suis]KFD64536.1 hypothetical protein M514_09760 [Trichuris suis]
MHCSLLKQLLCTFAFLVALSNEQSPFITENADMNEACVQMKTHFQKKEEEIKEAIKRGYDKGKTASFAGHLQRYRDERRNCGTYCKPLREKVANEIRTNGTTKTYVLLRQCRLMCYKSSVLPIARAITNHPSNLARNILATLGINITAWPDDANEVDDPTVTVSPETTKIFAQNIMSS